MGEGVSKTAKNFDVFYGRPPSKLLVKVWKVCQKLHKIRSRHNVNWWVKIFPELGNRKLGFRKLEFRILNFKFWWSRSGELHTDFDENKIKHSIISDLVVLNSKGLNNINSNTVQSSNKIPKGSGPSSSGVVSLK